MELEVLQENLSKVLSSIGRIIPSRAQLPILSSILLETDKGRLKTSATNLETGASYWLGAKIEKEGKTAIPAKILTEFILSLPPDKISLSLQEGILTVKSGSYSATFACLPSEEFPPLPRAQEKEILAPPVKNFLEAISQVVFSAAQDEGRPVLAGVKIFEEEGLVLAATDGFRLSVKKIIGEKTGLERPLIIPARTLAEVGRIMAETKEEKLGISQTKEGNQIIFSFKDAEVISRLIEGEFPDFNKIIPSSFTTKALLDKEKFSRAVRLAAIFSRGEANIVKLKFEKGSLTISANAPQVGGNKSVIEANIEGEGGEIAFNFRFLLDFLSSVSQEEITFEMTGPLAPGVLKPVGDESFLHLIMPVRLQG